MAAFRASTAASSGVDLFFVLSGFLITSLLLDELGRTGRIDLRGFWIRRARRLLPALLLMGLAVVAVRTLFSPDSVETLRTDAVAAFLWTANWAFIAHKADYFSQGAARRRCSTPGRWGGGAVLPRLAGPPGADRAGACGPGRWRRGATATLGRVRIVVAVVAGLGVLASATEAVLMASDARLNRVYFGTDTRAQALLVGAAAAALLVRDWPAVLAGWSLIRSRWVKWVARILPVLGWWCSRRSCTARRAAPRNSATVC